MIILEGTDHTGKTTFAKLLCEKMAALLGGQPLGYYAHMSKPREDFDHVSGYMNGIGTWVQDRYHLGSLVYGRILGGGCFPSARRMRIVQSYLRWKGCLTVIMTCSRDALHARLKSSIDREEMYRHDQILDAGDAFNGLSLSNNAGEPYCDLSIDVSDKFPDAEAASRVMQMWQARFLR